MYEQFKFDVEVRGTRGNSDHGEVIKMVESIVSWLVNRKITEFYITKTTI